MAAFRSVNAGDRRVAAVTEIKSSVIADGVGGLEFRVYDQSNAGKFFAKSPEAAEQRRGVGIAYLTYEGHPLWNYEEGEIGVNWALQVARYTLENGGQITVARDPASRLICGASFDVPYAAVAGSHTPEADKIVAETLEYAAKIGIPIENLRYGIDRVVTTELQGLGRSRPDLVGIGTAISLVRDYINYSNGAQAHNHWTSERAYGLQAALTSGGSVKYAYARGIELMLEKKAFGFEKEEKRPYFIHVLNGSEAEKAKAFNIVRP